MANLNMVLLVFNDRAINFGKVARIELDTKNKFATLWADTGYRLDEVCDEDYDALIYFLNNDDMRQQVGLVNVVIKAIG